MAAAIIGGLLSGCSPAAPDDLNSTARSAASTMSPFTTPPVSMPPASMPSTTSLISSGPVSSGPVSSGPVSVDSSGSRSTETSSTTEPPGTVVPFRTVAPGSAAGKRIGLVASTGSDPFSLAVAESIVTQVQAAGAELISCDPGADATLALDCARRLATQQVAGWIIVQPGNLGDALCAVGPQDVPLIAISAAVSCQTAEVGADDGRAGFLAGLELGQSAQTGSGCAYDTLVIVSDNAMNMVSTTRSEGIRTGFNTRCAGLPATEVLLEAGTQDRAYAAFTNALTTLPDDADILVAAVDDGAALGVIAAIPAGRAAHITMAAIGADQRARCEIIANPQWIGDAALFPDRYGEVAVPALLDAIAGREIPPTMHVASTFVTAESLSNFYDLRECPGQ